MALRTDLNHLYHLRPQPFKRLTRAASTTVVVDTVELGKNGRLRNLIGEKNGVCFPIYKIPFFSWAKESPNICISQNAAPISTIVGISTGC